MLNIKNLKNDFPIFKKYPELIYLDSAATSQKPSCVINRIVKFYHEENANVHRGIYTLSELATEEYENARKIVAKFINAKSLKEVIFTCGTTDSINLVGYSWIWKNVFENDTILTTEMEHHSNFIPWQQAIKYKSKVALKLIKVTKSYEIDLTDLEMKLTKSKPKLLAITHVSNVLGTINPIKKIVEIKNRVSPNTRILVDGAQSIAHIPVDVYDLGIDFFVFSGHKLYGPTGIGVLWAKQEILEDEMSPFRYGGGMIQNVEVEDSTWADLPEKFEGGTPNIAGAIGLAEAIGYVNSISMNQILKHEQKLTEYALSKLDKISGIQIFGPPKIDNRIGVISLSLDNLHPHDIAQVFDGQGIAVRAGHHCNQILMKQVLKVSATTRISLGIYNTIEDIDKLCTGILKVKKIFGKFKT